MSADKLQRERVLVNVNTSSVCVQGNLTGHLQLLSSLLLQLTTAYSSTHRLTTQLFTHTHFNYDSASTSVSNLTLNGHYHLQLTLQLLSVLQLQLQLRYNTNHLWFSCFQRSLHQLTLHLLSLVRHQQNVWLLWALTFQSGKILTCKLEKWKKLDNLSALTFQLLLSLQCVSKHLTFYWHISSFQCLNTNRLIQFFYGFNFNWKSQLQHSILQYLSSN